MVPRTRVSPALVALLVFVLSIMLPVASMSVTTTSQQPVVGSQSCPSGIAVDNAGGLYWANFCSGQLLTLPKPAPSSLPESLSTGLNGPIGVGVDGSGNVYFDEYYTGSLSELSPNSTTRVLATGLGHPSFLSVDSDGDVYLVNGTGSVCGNQILMYDHVLGKIRQLPVPTQADGYAGVFVAQGGLYYATCDQMTINVLRVGATAPTVLLNVPGKPYGIAVDRSGNIFYTVDNSTLYELPVNNTIPSPITSSGSTKNQLAIDQAGNLYYTDYVGGNIWMLPTPNQVLPSTTTLVSTATHTVTTLITSMLTTNVASQVLSAATVTSVSTSVSTQTFLETRSYNLTQTVPFTQTSVVTVGGFPGVSTPWLAAIIGLLAVAIIIPLLITRSRRPKQPVGTQVASATPAVGPSGLDIVDRIVFRYVEDRHGEISITKAAAELGVSESELQESLARLVSRGLLAGEEKR